MRFYRECVLTAVAGRMIDDSSTESVQETTGANDLRDTTEDVAQVHTQPLAGDSETGSIPLAGIQDVVQDHTLH